MVVKNLIYLKLMKIQILSGNQCCPEGGVGGVRGCSPLAWGSLGIPGGNYCAFAIQNNRCCLTVQMHKAFLRGLTWNFLILTYAFWRALKRVSKSGATLFSQKIDLRLYWTQPTIYYLKFGSTCFQQFIYLHSTP